MTAAAALRRRLAGRRVCVLAGGPSCERDVSLVSGRAVHEALRSAGLDAFLMDPQDGFAASSVPADVGVVFLALHGTFGEDGTVQAILEKAGVPYTGSGPAASRNAFDKSLAQPILREAGLRIPAYRHLRAGEIAETPDPLEYPVVVKPSASGSSVGISLLEKPGRLAEACREAFRHSETALIEERVRGRELTVGVLGPEALPVVEIVARRTFYDYEAKYGSSGTEYLAPADLDEDVSVRLRQAALTAHRALGCRVMSRADFILPDDGIPRILEVNTIPGLTGRSLLPKAAAAAGIDFTELCVRIILISLERQGLRVPAAFG